MENAKKLVDEDNQIIGEFMCQGKIDPRLTEAFAKRSSEHHHSMTPERAARHERAKNHSEAQDLNNAKEVFQNILRQLNHI